MTSYEQVIDVFLRMVEEDRNYFSYFRVDDETAMSIAQERAMGFLFEATARISMECGTSLDWSIDNEIDGEFHFELNAKEVYLVASLMYERYMSRDVAYLKRMDVNFTGTEMRVFDPSNARKTFNTLYQDVCTRNEYLLDVYKNTDRDTGAYNEVDFVSYDVTDYSDWYGVLNA